MAHSLEPLYGKTISQLQAICIENNLPKFAAKQIALWLYKKHIFSIDEMTNVSSANRESLKSKFFVGRRAPLKESLSKDGTKKYLYETNRSQYIESAYIPDGDRATLCLSSQAGCRMGCLFCATSRQGLQHSLSTNEILNQMASLPERDSLSNIVFMGMGEPLDNADNVLAAIEILTADWGYGWSPYRITLSTAGVSKELRRLLDTTSVHLAVSLHNPYSDERAEIMPIERAYPIAEVVEILREYDFSHQRRVSFEYILMSGKNNSPHHIRELCRLLNGLKCRINIIKFHKIPDSPYFSPDDEKITRFRDSLTAKGFHTTIRQSRGEDIEAACGLLSTKEQIGKEIK
ncbi:MAG: 23S rRNA (adenine(2503)-C(2))-methyltransferase RlmN [Rikenellaceae bacterium]